jgi:hypothetical protein
MRNILKSKTLRAKTTTEIQYSQIPLYGRLWRRIDTIPVPIVTENHLTQLEHEFNRGRVRECSLA